MKLRNTMLAGVILCGLSMICHAQLLLPTGEGGQLLLLEDEDGKKAKRESKPDVQVDDKQAPDWVLELVKLPLQEREAYITAFKNARLCYTKQELMLCESYLNTCEMILSGNPNVWLIRAGVLLESKQYEPALLFLQKAEEVIPNDRVLLWYYMHAYIALKRWDECAVRAEQLIIQLPNHRDFQLRQSVIFCKYIALLYGGQSEKAAEIVKELSPMDDDPLYYFTQAVQKLRAGSLVAAQDDVERANRIFSGVPELRFFNKTYSLLTPRNPNAALKLLNL